MLMQQQRNHGCRFRIIAFSNFNYPPSQGLEKETTSEKNSKKPPSSSTLSEVQIWLLVIYIFYLFLKDQVSSQWLNRDQHLTAEWCGVGFFFSSLSKSATWSNSEWDDSLLLLMHFLNWNPLRSKYRSNWHSKKKNDPKCSRSKQN